MIVFKSRGARGASTVEFVIVAPLLAALGLGTLQAGLAYHARSVLNYATFEAARTGAVNHALGDPMRKELAARLAPLIGGDGSGAAAASAIATSMLRVTPDPFTRLRIINPSTEAFDHFRIRSRESGKDVIPNSHLRFRSDERAALDPVSGVDLRDANLLKIQVRHGFDMKVPLVGAMAAPLLTLLDPENAAYYAAGKLPISSVATVRMQSEVWRDSLVSMSPAPESAEGVPGESAAVPAPTVASDAPRTQPSNDSDSESEPHVDAEPQNGIEESGNEPAGERPTGAEVLTECQGPFASGQDPFLPSVNDQACAVGDAGGGPLSSPIEPPTGSTDSNGGAEC